MTVIGLKDNCVRARKLSRKLMARHSLEITSYNNNTGTTCSLKWTRVMSARMIIAK